MLRDLRRVVDRFGWAVLHGGGAGPVTRAGPHTVGLTGLGHPEVIVVGLPFEAGETYLNLVGEAVRAGARFSAGWRRPRPSPTPTPRWSSWHVTDTVPAGRARAVLHGSVDALQLVWPDSAGTLPWEEGHRNPPRGPAAARPPARPG